MTTGLTPTIERMEIDSANTQLINDFNAFQKKVEVLIKSGKNAKFRSLCKAFKAQYASVQSTNFITQMSQDVEVIDTTTSVKAIDKKIIKDAKEELLWVSRLVVSKKCN